MKRLKQIEVAMWFDAQNPLIDKPHEIGGVMQDTLEETLRFTSEMIRSHWLGECDCVKDAVDGTRKIQDPVLRIREKDAEIEQLRYLLIETSLDMEHERWATPPESCLRCRVDKILSKTESTEASDG